jgi:hypothetical protein
MGELGNLVDEMTVPVSTPYARWEVMLALASLSDREYQERVWIRQQLPHKNYIDNFDNAVHALYDDWIVLPEPRAAVGSVLVNGPEVERIAALGVTLDGLLEELGESPDSAYLAHADWDTVLAQASSALSAMVLAGHIKLE